MRGDAFLTRHRCAPGADRPGESAGAPGLVALDRLADAEPPRRVREAVSAVSARESEPVGPRR
ncbi:hypothetical protein [Streptomyces sp. Z26]|uniref:hypothetical protein n=1 Tax=Streptomyces sp. Z26 TaxID=2500177 RepID=UPI000EF13933|nr:hypothetical protein [Streptomyces sp. Z26]RLL69361.1 hypothetical protein D7M15_23840 [Streptomyces sp. Z26]